MSLVAIIELDNVTHFYGTGEERVRALSDVTLRLEAGEFTAIVGHNGSGKSTLAKMLNGLVIPTSGRVRCFGIDTADTSADIFDIRRRLGIVFQNPDNQMVATIIEDDIAFGPENLGVESSEINRRVDWALKLVGMEEHRKGTASRLSGGQKQRIAIAGVLACKPEVIVFDESTSMLDPEGRRGILDVIMRLRDEGITVVLITHFMEEAVRADRIVALANGSVIFDGGKELFFDPDKLSVCGLEQPVAVRIGSALAQRGINLDRNALTEEGLLQALTMAGKISDDRN